MADGVAITAGTGTTIATDDAGASGHVQLFKLAIATDGSATLIPADANGLTSQGPAAEDAALAGNPLRIGGRAHSGVPTAVSADNDVVTPWFTREGVQVVMASARTVRVAATPAMTAASYITGEQIGAVTTFTGAALATGRSGTILSAFMTSTLAPATIPALDLFLFEVSPTLVGGNDAACDITDGNLPTGRPFAVIKFLAANYSVLTNNSTCVGTVAGSALLSVPFVTATTANLFGVLVSRATFTGASNANEITLRIVQD